MSRSTGTQPTPHTLECRMLSEPAALERLCQVIRIRGFRVDQMQVLTDGNTLSIALTLTGSRPVSMLQSQLEKLHTVLSVTSTVTAPMRQSA